MAAETKRRYETNLTDEQWALIRPLVQRERRLGRPTVVDLREVVNALLYLTRTGCQWRLLPIDFPNWNTVRYYFDHWMLDGTFIRINDMLREGARQKAGRNAEPSAGIIDSQSVKTTEAGGQRGFDGGKRITGRKRHILVDTQGNLLVVVVHAANIPDRDGADWVLEEAVRKHGRLRHSWADGGYTGDLVEWWQTERGITIVMWNEPNLTNRRCTWGFHTVNLCSQMAPTPISVPSGGESRWTPGAGTMLPGRDFPTRM